MKETIFVFGSNLSGRHGAGAALAARRLHGAIYGRGAGRQGSSYAIPTRDYDVYTSLPLEKIQFYVAEFILYARSHPDLIFEVTPVGCGRAGYAANDIAPMFKDAPSNCRLPSKWREMTA